MGFKQRQSTPWARLVFAIFGLLDLLAAAGLLFGMIYGNYIAVHIIMVEIVCIAMGVGCLWWAKVSKYLEIEDLGTSLKVSIGPSVGLYFEMGHIDIAYDDIKSYEEPSGCCEACCGKCVAVNPCGCCGGLRGLGMRSADCSQKMLIITFKTQQTVLYQGRNHKFKRVAFTVEPKNYNDLKQLLDQKCFSKESVVTTI